MSIAVTNAEVAELLKAVGSDVIRAYRDKYFPARIIQACPNIYSIENAANWVKPDKFCAFVAHTLQEQSPPPTTPSTRITELGSDTETPPQKRARATSLAHSGTDGGMSAHPARTASSSLRDDSFDSAESDNTADASAPRKRKRGDEKLRAQKPTAKMAAGMIRITRQCWVDHVETTTEAPENWRIPEAAQAVAYVVDLSTDPHDYKDAKGKALAMSAIIKHKCTDGWAGGSGGSLSKPTTVSILGQDVKCQKMSHECRGAFVCSMAAPDLWQGYKRYDHDFETLPDVWPPLDDRDGLESYAHIEQALRFYNGIVKEKCQFDNGRCTGKPVLRPHDQVSLDGKYHYISCSAWAPGNVEHGHLLRQIPRNLDEPVIRQFFDTGRNNFSNTLVCSTPCIFQVPPRTGMKQKQCPHIHIQNGKIVEGVIQHRPCPAKITIFSPVDHALRKAVVIPVPGVPHNHPSHPSDKLTRRAKAALRAAGLAETASSIVDRPPTSPSECLDAHMSSAGPSNSLHPLAPGTSISTFLSAGYIQQYY